MDIKHDYYFLFMTYTYVNIFSYNYFTNQSIIPYFIFVSLQLRIVFS